MRRVVVTGLGIVSSIGNNADEVRTSLYEAKSGISFSEEFAEHGFRCRVWGAPTLDPAELIAFLAPRLPHFMVPRYVRILADLPKTPTQKVEKHILRSEGLTEDTWDRENAGIRFKRERLASAGAGIRAFASN